MENMTVHKTVGRWADTPQSRAIWGDRFDAAKGNHITACNSRAYWVQTDPPQVTRLNKKVTCKRCLKALSS